MTDPMQDYDTFEVICKDGSQVTVQAEGYDYDPLTGVLELKPGGFKNQQGTFQNPQGIHRTFIPEEDQE